MSSSNAARSDGFKLSRSVYWPYVTLLLWVVPLVLMRSAGQSLMAHDEGIYAIQAKSIVETGDLGGIAIEPHKGDEQRNFGSVRHSSLRPLEI